VLVGLGAGTLALIGFRKHQATAAIVADMAAIPAGDVQIGNLAGDARKCEGPPRRAHVHSFRLDRTEVTLADYRRCEAAGKCTSTKPHATEQKKYRGPELCNELRADAGERVDNHPINCVDRIQAAAYCAFVGKRLPTGEEWERAARGPSNADYPWGNAAPTCDKAVYARGVGYGRDACGPDGTAPVASTPASGYGLFDLAGNVWEWTSSSCAAAAAPATSSATTIPPAPTVTPQPSDPQEEEIASLLKQLQGDQGETNGPGTIRGGGFEWNATNLKAWRQLPWPPEQGGVSTGFRCAMDEP
jgi:formylglycine-generating enzyme required for sulfatase activity